MKMLARYLKPLTLRLSIGVSIKFVGSLLELMLPYIMGYLLDNVVPVCKQSGSSGKIWLYGGIMTLCAVGALFGNAIANKMSAATTRDAIRQIRQDLFRKTIALSDAKITYYSIPTLEMRLTGDTYNVHRMVGMMQRIGIRAPILLLGGITLTMIMEPVLTMILLCTLPIIAIVVFFVTKKGVPLYGLVQKTTDGMVRIVRENITGIRVVKALSKTEYEKGRFSDINQKVSASETKAGVTMALTGPVMNILLNGGLTVVVFVGAYRVNGGVCQPGTIIAFMSYFTIILNAMMSITRIFVECSKGLASAGRIEEILCCPDETEELPVLDNGKSAEGMLCFENVSFSYNGNKNNLENISFCLPKGGKLGIIGATGSGKSTIVKLIMRFYDPNEGTVYLDGKDIRSYALHDLRVKFGVSLQNDFLYADTIGNNINFERDLSEEQIEHAAAMAQADDFIRWRVNGLEEQLAIAGHNLSGGQRQRMFVSRAVAGNPEILILDDSSSALDYKTDASMRQSIDTMVPRPTTVIVAQRVSSVKNCDVIIVMEDGRADAIGTHEQLMRQSAIYREIAETQMGDDLYE